jgi:hypothetical protein
MAKVYKVLDDDGREIEVPHQVWLGARLAEYEANCERRYRAGELLDGTLAVALTSADIGRAVGVVAAIAAIESLSTGIVGFDSGLRGGYWYRDTEAALDLGDYLTFVAIPDGNDLVALRAAVIKGVESARDEVREHMADVSAEASRRGYEPDHRDDEMSMRSLELVA